MTCSQCGKTADVSKRAGCVFLTHWNMWGKRRVEWTVCSECEQRGLADPHNEKCQTRTVRVKR